MAFTFNDAVRNKTVARYAFQKGVAGANFLPDWIQNQELGKSVLGTPYYDDVTFKLDDLNFTSTFIDCSIVANTTANIVRTNINGRKGSVKQLIGEGDWEIVFNIKVTAEYNALTFGNNNVTTAQVGSKNAVAAAAGAAATLSPFSALREFNVPRLFEGDYYPNSEVAELLQFFSKFYQDKSYTNIAVESLYLNDVFGIFNIVPYSISTQQNTEATNCYNIVINAYSDYPDDTSEYEDEIIPK